MVRLSHIDKGQRSHYDRYIDSRISIVRAALKPENQIKFDQKSRNWKEHFIERLVQKGKII